MTTSWNNITLSIKPSSRNGMGMVYNTINDTIYMFGGEPIQTTDNLVWTYKVGVPGSQWISLPLNSNPPKRSRIAMVYNSNNNTIYMYGGFNNININSIIYYNEFWSYNVSTNTWYNIPLMGINQNSDIPRSVIGMSMTFDVNSNDIYVCGGTDTSGNYITNIYFISSTALLWTFKLGWTTIFLNNLSSVYDPFTKKIYGFGGSNATGLSNVFWYYNVLNNSDSELISPVSGNSIPSPRTLMQMVYNNINSTIYMFGGYDGINLLNELWTYNVSTNIWLNNTPLSSPLKRIDFSMVYCNTNYNIYMFGGGNTGLSYNNDLWSLSYNYACFQQGTQIMTPAGYCSIENLKAGDDVTLYNSGGASTPIIELIHFKCDQTQCPLYCLPKDTLSENIPLHDLYMAGNHAFKDLAGQWHHMKCSAETHSVNKETIDYYHIVTSDYYAHTICAEGVEVETCFKDKSDGKSLVWICNKTCCTPYIKQSTNDSELCSITM